MHESHPMEKDLRTEAERIGRKYKGAPVIVIVGGSVEAGVPRCMLGSNMHSGERLRGLLGVLEATKQIESLKHFGLFGKESVCRRSVGRKGNSR